MCIRDRCYTYFHHWILELSPWLGLAIGAVAGAISGAMSDYGINDDFITEVGVTIKPGGSALFLLISKWTEDKALEKLKKFDAQSLEHPCPKKMNKSSKLHLVQVSNSRQ